MLEKVQGSDLSYSKIVMNKSYNGNTGDARDARWAASVFLHEANVGEPLLFYILYVIQDTCVLDSLL